MQPNNSPQWVREEIARREQEASDAYRSLPGQQLVSEHFYIERYLASHYPDPPAWTSDGSQETSDAPKD